MAERWGGEEGEAWWGRAEVVRAAERVIRNKVRARNR